MNTVQQHCGKRILTGAGTGAGVAMYFGRNMWLALAVKPITRGEWIEMM